MKTTRHFFNVIILVGLSIPLAHAQSDSVGHGGIGMICRDGNNQIVKARLLDLWEAESFTTDQDFSAPVETQVENALKKIYSIDAETSESIRKKVDEVRNTAFYTKKEINLTNDALPDYAPSNHCHFEQIARFGYVNELDAYSFRINQNLYANTNLSNTDKAALLFHEAIYAIDVKYNHATDSQLTRRIVSRLFSSVGLDTELKGSLVILGGKPLNVSIFPSLEDQVAVTLNATGINRSDNITRGRCSYELIQGDTLILSANAVTGWRNDGNMQPQQKTIKPIQGILKAGELATMRVRCRNENQISALTADGQSYPLPTQNAGHSPGIWLPIDQDRTYTFRIVNVSSTKNKLGEQK